MSFGVTAFELAALGVPALYLALSEDHARSASAFEEAGIGKVLGVGRVLRADDIARIVWELIRDDEKRRDMRAGGLALVDGRAAERIAADLSAALASARTARRTAVS